MHFYAFNIGDYASHTRHLTHMEDLAYRRLLDLYYLHEQPLNGCLTVVARLINMREFESEVQAVLEEFFELQEGLGWVHRRADDEISRYHGKLEAASRAGKASAQRRFNDRSTDVQLNKKQSQETRNNPKKEEKETATVVADPVSDPDPVIKVKKAKADPGPMFEKFWEAYDYKRDRHEATKAWVKINPDQELAQKIVDAADLYRKVKKGSPYYRLPTTWLNARNWEDDPATLVPKIARTLDKTEHQIRQDATAKAIFGTVSPNRIIDVEASHAENATPRLG